MSCVCKLYDCCYMRYLWHWQKQNKNATYKDRNTLFGKTKNYIHVKLKFIHESDNLYESASQIRFNVIASLTVRKPPNVCPEGRGKSVKKRPTPKIANIWAKCTAINRQLIARCA